jgi:hypothetical protein
MGARVGRRLVDELLYPGARVPGRRTDGGWRFGAVWRASVAASVAGGGAMGKLGAAPLPSPSGDTRSRKGEGEQDCGADERDPGVMDTDGCVVERGGLNWVGWAGRLN